MKVPDATAPQPTDRESKATAAINQLLEVWESGDLPRHIERSTIRRQAGSSRPCDSWSLGNQLLMLLPGADDARGFRQWEQVGRKVRKGERAFFIFAPCTRKVEDPDPPGTTANPPHNLHRLSADAGICGRVDRGQPPRNSRLLTRSTAPAFGGRRGVGD